MQPNNNEYIRCKGSQSYWDFRVKNMPILYSFHASLNMDSKKGHLFVLLCFFFCELFAGLKKCWYGQQGTHRGKFILDKKSVQSMIRTVGGWYALNWAGM